MLAILSAVRPEAIFHLAAHALAAHESRQVESLVQSNILFGTQLLESAVKSGVRYFVNTGTFWQHYRSEAYNPVSLYAAMKQAFEAILVYYQNAHSLRCTTLELTDTYGPCDHRKKLFHQLKQAQTSGVPLLMTPGMQCIDLVYIDDVVDGFLQALHLIETEERICGMNFSISSGRNLTLREVVSLFEAISGAPVPIVWGGKPYRTREVMQPCRITPLPGWTTKTTLEDGLRQMFALDKADEHLGAKP